MAMVRVRHPSIFVEGKKVGQCYKTKSDINSGDELQYGDDGVIGVSDGAGNWTLEFDMIIPVAGADVNPEVMLANKQFVDIQYGIENNKILASTMRFQKAVTDGDAKAGTLTGSYTLIGPMPSFN